MATSMLDGKDVWAATAYEDLTGKVNLFAGLDSTGKIMVARQNQTVMGVIIEEATAGNAASIQRTGVAKVIVGAVTVSAGARLSSDGSGKAVAYVSGAD